MNDRTNQQLLSEFADGRSEAAFTELVRRHVDLVHSAALRMTGEAHSAQDVTQAVFVALAQNAARLNQHPVLSGWLHTTARNLAAKYVRATVRRQNHEQEAAAMNELLSTAPDPPWNEIAPYLDVALGELNEPDRDAVLLRYFEKKSAQEMAEHLGISTDAAQKRVSRALERLREFFAKRGVSAGASGLAVVISANAVQAAPVGLAIIISTSALAGTAVATTLVAATTKTIAMTTLQKTLVAVTVAVLAGAGIYEARQVSKLRGEVQTLQQQQAPLEAQVEQLDGEWRAATNQLIALRDENSRLRSNAIELLRLRKQVSHLKSATRIQNRENSVPTNEGVVGLVPFGSMLLPVSGDEKQLDLLKRLEAERQARLEYGNSNKLASLMTAINLNSEQEEQVRALLLRSVLLHDGPGTGFRSAPLGDLLEMSTRTPMEITAMTSEMKTNEAAEYREAIANADEQLRALLSSSQQTVYEEYKKAQISARLEQFAIDPVLSETLGLSKDQRERTSTALANLWSATAQPPAGLNFGEWFLEQQLNTLEGILSQDQSTQLRRLISQLAKPN